MSAVTFPETRRVDPDKGSLPPDRVTAFRAAIAAEEPVSPLFLSWLAVAAVHAIRSANRRMLDALHLLVEDALGTRKRVAPSDTRTAGRLGGVLEVLNAALEQTVPSLGDMAVERASSHHRMLEYLAANPNPTNVMVGDVCGFQPSTVSRTGRLLIQRGLAVRTRVGRQNFWDVTPRGRHVLAKLAEGAGPSEGPEAGLEIASVTLPVAGVRLAEIRPPQFVYGEDSPVPASDPPPDWQGGEPPVAGSVLLRTRTLVRPVLANVSPGVE